jgi:methyl-accepting chemotaxis protein
MNILSFGVFLLDKLSFARKFQLILVMLLLPILYASWAIYNSEMAQITVLEKEQVGLVTINNIHPLRILGAKHRGSSAQWFAGDLGKKSNILDIEAKVSRQFSLLEQDLQSSIYNQKTLATARVLKDNWNNMTFSQYSNKEAATNFINHSDWIKEIGLLVNSVANQSDLALDASMDTYNMMSLVTVSIPTIQELLGKIRGVGSAVATKGSFGTDTFIQVKTLSGQLKDMIPVIEQGFNILRQFYPQHTSVYKNVYSNYESAVNNFEKTTETRLLEPDTPTISGDEYFSEASLAIDAAEKLFKVIDQLFLARLEIYTADRYTSLFYVFSVFSILLCICTYLLLCLKTSIDRNVQTALNMASDLESNILNSSYSSISQDELGKTIRALGSAFKKLAVVVSGVRNNSNDLSQSSSSLETVSTEVNQLCSDQQGKVSIIVTAATQLAATAKEVASHCENAAIETQGSQEKALEGAQRSQASAVVIRELAESIRSAGDEISQLAQQAASISTVIDVIKAIAEQTNLLALNAAIEAARAGEQGRGFAVVADEVRTLANRTQQSTNEIETTISSLQQVAEKAVLAMDHARNQANTGEQEAISTGEMLATIQSSVNEVSALIQQVSTAGEQQASAAEEIAQHIQGVDDASVDLVSKAKEVLSIASDVGAGSHQLSGVMQKFKT